MDSRKDRGALPKLLSEAILQLCRVGVGLHGSFSIDGIICIENVDAGSQEVVVKIHEKICGGVLLQTNTNVNQPVNSAAAQTNENTVSARVSNTFNLNTAGQNYTTSVQNQTADPQVSYGVNSYPQPTAEFNQKRDDFSGLHDSDCEILDDTTHKQLIGELGNICDTDLGGLYDVDFGDVAIKPDPARNKNSCSPAQIATSSKAIDEVSDDELKIEKLTAGRVRKPNKSRNSYRDVHGASVQVLSFEEYSRTLKSEKLKRGRDRSPDFISSKRMLKSTPDQQFTQAHGIVSQAYHASVGASQIASVNDANIASIRSLSSVTRTTSSEPNTAVSGRIPSKHSDPQIAGAEVPSRPVHSASITRNPSKGKLMGSGQSEIVTKKTVRERVSSKRGHSVISQDIGEGSKRGNNGVHILYRNSKAAITRSEDSECGDCDSHAQASIHPDTAETKAAESADTGGTVSEQQSVGKSLVCFDDFSQNAHSKPHKCPCCTEIYDTFKELDFHMYKAHSGKFMCPLCGKLFKQKNTRNRHIVAVHSSNKNFACNLCSVSFTRIDSIKKHYKSHHPDMEVPKCPYSYKRGESTVPSEPELVYMQDIAGSDIKYIEETLMAVAGPGEIVQDVVVQDVVPTNLVMATAASTPGVTENASDPSPPGQLLALDQENPTSLLIDGQRVTLEPVSSNVVLEAMQSPSVTATQVVAAPKCASVTLNVPRVIDSTSNASDYAQDDNSQTASSFMSIIKSASVNSLHDQQNNVENDEDTGDYVRGGEVDQSERQDANIVSMEDDNSNFSVNVIEVEVDSCASNDDRCQTVSPQSESAHGVHAESPDHQDVSVVKTTVLAVPNQVDGQNTKTDASSLQSAHVTAVPNVDSVMTTKRVSLGKVSQGSLFSQSASVTVTVSGANTAPSAHEEAMASVGQQTPLRAHPLARVIHNAQSVSEMLVTASERVGGNRDADRAGTRGTADEHVDEQHVDDDGDDASKSGSTIEISDEEMESPD